MTNCKQNYVADVAIVGAGPSGLFMVFEAGFLGYTAVVLDALPQIGGQLAALYPEKPIYDVPGHPTILAGELIEKLKKQSAPYAPTYLLGEPVIGLTDNNGTFTLETESNTVQARAVIIAGGGGMFTPRKPTQIADLADFEAAGSVKYAITKKHELAGQDVVLAGGGDSAVDWAVEMAHIANHVHVVHRRADFRAAEATVAEMKKLVDEGRITLHTPYQLQALEGTDGKLDRVVIADLDGATRTVQAQQLVCCFGLAPNVGPMADWGLGLERGVVPVDRATMMTNRHGLLCIGDMAGYEGKVALILTGFAEAAVAAKTVQAIIHPDRKYRVQYSTSKGIPGQPGVA
ncbi:MAG: NAD(P)/FAD-dependent oxidoreductase [Alphaproteobacteria bacterium]|nr:MAG: NAD(P)/FAD-dependent oxidoreductase [Alphaproteobacteria bacterium]